VVKPEKTQRVFTVLVTWGILLAVFGVYQWSFVKTQKEFLERESFRTLSAVAGRLKARVEKAQKSFSSFLTLSQVEKKDPEVLASYLRSYLDIKGKKTQDEAIVAAQKCASSELLQKLLLKSDRLTLSIYCYSSGKPNADQSNRIDILSYDITPDVSTFSGSNGQDDIFDDVLVADRNGRVLFQYSQTGPQNSQAGTPIASLKSLLASGEAASKPGSTSPSSDSPSSPQAGTALYKLAQSSAVTDVVLADVNYKLFSQPVHLPLGSGSVAEGTADVLVCALVNTGRFDKESHAVPYSKVIWAAMIGVLLFSLSWPLFKLRYMSDTERFSVKDGWFLAFAIFLVSTSGTLMLLNSSYTVQARHVQDRTLKQLADRIKRNFDIEMVEALAELQQLRPVATRAPSHNGARGTALLLPNYLIDDDAQLDCYPFFEAAFWTDETGQQVLRLDVRGSSTPAINVSSFPFFQAVKKAGSLTPEPQSDSGAIPPCPIPPPDSQYQARQQFDNIFNSNHAYIDPVLSRTTDEFSVVLANARPDAPGIEGLAMKPMSLVDPVLPPGYGFAVIDGDCKVLFHSQSFRNMRENFCQESKDRYELKPVLLSAVDNPMDVSYLGQTERAYVTEISSTHFAAGPAFLIVFRQPGVQLTLNLAIILVCSILLGAYLAILVLIALLHLALRRPFGLIYPPEFIWPQPREALNYLELFVANGAMLLAFWSLYKYLFEAPLLAMSLAIPAIATLFLVLKLSPGKERLFPIGALLSFGGAVLFIGAIVQTPRGMLVWFKPGMPASLAWGSLLLLMGVAAVLLSGRRPWSRKSIRQSSKIHIMHFDKEPAWFKTMPRLFKHAWVWSGQKRSWLKELRRKNYGVAYTLMCVSVIVAVAVVPSVGFFKYAYDSVMELSLKHDQLDLSETLLARRDRIRTYYENIKLPKDKNLIEKRCAEYLDRYDLSGFKVAWDWNCTAEQSGNDQGENRAEVNDWRENLNDLIERRIATATLNFPSNQLGSEMSKLGLASTNISKAWEHSWEEPLPWQFKLEWKSTSRMPNLQIVSAYPQWQGLQWWAVVGLGLLFVILAWWILGLARNIFFIGVEPAPPWEDLNWTSATDIRMNYLLLGHAKSEKSQWLKSVLADGHSQWVDARAELKQMIGNPAYKTTVDKTGILVLDQFDYNLWDSQYNDKRLELLENLVYEAGEDFKILVVSTVDPLYFLTEGGPDVLSKEGTDPRRLLDRWARVLSRFKIGCPPEPMTKLFIKRFVRFIEEHPEKRAGEFVVWVCAECNCTTMLRRIGIDLFNEFRQSKKNSREEVVSIVLDRAESYYHVLWTSLAFAERQVLYQLALDGWTNAKSTETVRQLERKQLIYKGPMYRIMNESFRRFIESPEHEAEILEWQKEESASTWHAFRTVLIVVAMGVAVWMLYTQAALSQTVIGVIAGSATLLTAIGGLLGRFKSSKAPTGG